MRLTDKRYPANDSGPDESGPGAMAPGRRTRIEARYGDGRAGEAPIQRKGDGAVGETPALPGGGASLPAPVQEKMEGAFGADFSDVRVHADSPAPAQVGAVAYAQGRDIAFSPGQYDPSSHSGQELIGHELTHVVQQSSGQVGVQTKGGDVNADASLEREADDLGARAARGESVAVTGRGSGIQRKGENPQAIALEVTGNLMNGVEAGAAHEAAAQAAKTGVDAKLRPHVMQQAKAAADEAASRLILSATDGKSGTIFTTQHGTGEFTEATAHEGEEASDEIQHGHGYSQASSKEVGAAVERAGQEGGKEAATVMANRLAGETASSVAEEELEGAQLQIAQELIGQAISRVAAVRDGVVAKVATRVATLTAKSPQLSENAVRTVKNMLEERAVEQALADQSLFKAATKAAKKLKSSTASSAKETVSSQLAGQEDDVRRTAIGEAGVAARNALSGIEEASDDEDTAPLFNTLMLELETALEPYVGSQLKATRFHQFGRRRELREQLKGVARDVVNTEIEQLMPQGDERVGRENQLTYKETLAKREAYTEVKEDVDEFLTQIAAGIASRAARDQKMAMATCAYEAKKSHAKVDKALRAAKSNMLSHAKTQASAWVDQMYTALAAGGTAVQEAQQVSESTADVSELVRGRRVAEKSIEAADSEEGVGVIGHLLDAVIPDAGDGMSAKISLKIPLMRDPYGGQIAKVNLICDINGKAGRGTEGFVTAGVPAIASNPKHLEMELGYSIGIQAEAGASSVLGADVSASYKSFVRAGADSTQSAMAAFRYAIYRGTPIKSLAAAWYGGWVQKRGGAPQADYMLAEQHAAAVEEQHFRGEGKQRTFAQHGRGIGVDASAAAKAEGGGLAKLGAKADVSGGYSRLRMITGETLSALDDEGLGDAPTSREEAKERRSRMSKGLGSKGKNVFSASLSTEVNVFGQGVSVSGAISGTGLKDWGVELKAGIAGMLANNTPMDAIITVATQIYELEQKLLSALGSHIDNKEEMLAKGKSQEQIRNQLHLELQARNLIQGGVNLGTTVLSHLGIAEGSLAASFQFGLSGGKWTDRFDIISSTKIATPDTVPIVGAELVKETKLITAEHQGKGRRAFASPGVLSETSET